jgi:O-antigen ligase
VVLLVGIFRISTRTVEQSASRYDEIFQFIREPSSALSSNGTLAFHILDLVDAWNIIIQRPVLGYGFGSHYDRKLTLIEGAGGEDAGLEPGIVHDLYLHIWWKAGIPGLAIFCWLLVRFFRFGAASMAGPPSSPPQAIALGLYSAMWGDLAMELWGPQWFASTKVALVIFCSFALIVRLVQPEQNAQIASPVGLQPAEPDFGGS